MQQANVAERVGQATGQLDDKPEKANEKEAGGAVSIAGMRAILEQQAYRCALSGMVLTPDACSMDHKIPLCKGGSHTLDNIQFVAPAVNTMKGTMSDDQFIAICKLVAEQSARGED